MTNGKAIMKLRQPTDFLILEALHTYGRNVAPNISERCGKSRKNINNRLPVLDDYGLVRKVGPADRAGLYEITEEGIAALELRQEYDLADDFESMIHHRVESTAPSPTQVAARNDEAAEEESD